jgi:hypothetical protein
MPHCAGNLYSCRTSPNNLKNNLTVAIAAEYPRSIFSGTRIFSRILIASPMFSGLCYSFPFFLPKYELRSPLATIK